MQVDDRCPETGSTDQSHPAQESADGKPQVVDWFALTEGNVPASTVATTAAGSPAHEAALAVPSAAAIGGLRP